MLDAAKLAEMGFYVTRTFPATGEVAGIHQMVFTVALIVGIDEAGYRTRFCYESMGEAVSAMLDWDGTGDPPGNWIKEKGINRETGKPTDRSNPKFCPNPAQTDV